MTTSDEYPDLVFLADPDCTLCCGLGRRCQHDRKVPCNCVFREMFRVCRRHYLGYRRIETKTMRVRYSNNHSNFSRPAEEFCADFEMAARRALSPLLFRVFWLHEVLGWNWIRCQPRCHLDKGNFFHAVYRLEATLGRVFSTLEPYPLYPLSKYFGNNGHTRRQWIAWAAQAVKRGGGPPLHSRIRVPLRVPRALRMSA